MSGFDDLRADLKERQRDALSHGCTLDERVLAFSREMISHVNDYRHVFQAMVGKHSGALVQQLVHKLLVDLIRDDVKAMVPRDSTNSVSTEAFAQFIAGALFGLLMWWLDGKVRLSVEDLNALFRRLAIPAMEVAMRG